MSWHAELTLSYSRPAAKTILHATHCGPLRVLKCLYPEGDAVCHNVLVHPPSGLVAGDVLDIRVALASGSHALISTPGATRFYKSTGASAQQRVRAQVASGARLEWLPLENIAYNGCNGHNIATFNLAPGAEVIAWDVTALGLSASNLPFATGEYAQTLEVAGVWLEHGRIRAGDALLLNSPLGLDGQTCLGTLVFACGTALSVPRRELLLDATRAVVDKHLLIERAGATCPNPQVVVLRALSGSVEPLMQLFKAVWAVWRAQAWQMDAQPPRIWSV